ncbi:MAG: hypothetical protein QNJ11_05190 [Woeseiaceae bacterium]|nr:hypothetical protein [Woeseiaceae bacterium]
MTDQTASRSVFGIVSVILGFLAFAAVVGHFFAGPLDPPPPIEVSIAEKAADIRDATVAALKGEEFEARNYSRSRTLDDYLTYAFIGLAALAVLMAVVGFIRHEPMRPSIAGAALGALAITFQFLTVLFFALLFVLLLSAVIDKLDFSF